MNTNTDVIITGAGVVGLTLATALLRGGLRVTLLEAAKTPIPTPVAMDEPHFDHRVFAISRASENIFRAFKQAQGSVWDLMKVQRATAYHHMRVWEGSGELYFSNKAVYQENLGHIIEQQVILAALYEGLQDYTEIEILRGVSMQNFVVDDTQVHVHLSNGDRLNARLLVGADGARSQVRKQSGIVLSEKPYGHHALVATVRTELPHQSTAWQHFLPTGPLAFLPLSDPHVCSIVWSTSPTQAQQLLAYNEQQFCEALQEAFEERLGLVESVADRTVFPLFRRHAEHYVQPRLALVGDAMRTIHPLAGQGVNMGLLDAASLADVVIHNHKQQRDIGDAYLLQRYERWRKGHNLLMLNAMGGLKQLFSQQQLPFRFARRLGMRLINQNEPMKRRFIEQAMGLHGDLPSLAQTRDYT